MIIGSCGTTSQIWLVPLEATTERRRPPHRRPRDHDSHRVGELARTAVAAKRRCRATHRRQGGSATLRGLSRSDSQDVPRFTRSSSGWKEGTGGRRSHTGGPVLHRSSERQDLLLPVARNLVSERRG